MQIIFLSGTTIAINYYANSLCSGDAVDVYEFSNSACQIRNGGTYEKLSIVPAALTHMPSSAPSATPSMIPTFSPTCTPSLAPSQPTPSPTSATPTQMPSAAPTGPTMMPTASPTGPTMMPTATPTTTSPTPFPTSSVPSSASPTLNPTAVPTDLPKFTTETRRACFAGTETVTLESGDFRPISDVKIGDRVLAANSGGEAKFSDVIFVPHSTNTEFATFAQISTVGGRDIKMTQNHILPSGVCGSTSSMPLVYASQVSVGDCILTVSGEERVSKVISVHGEGVYTVVTNEEFVIVNGIVASPFGVNHMMANFYYNVHRFLYVSAPLLMASSTVQRMNEVTTSPSPGI